MKLFLQKGNVHLGPREYKKLRERSRGRHPRRTLQNDFPSMDDMIEKQQLVRADHTVPLYPVAIIAHYATGIKSYTE